MSVYILCWRTIVMALAYFNQLPCTTKTKVSVEVLMENIQEAKCFAIMFNCMPSRLRTCYKSYVHVVNLFCKWLNINIKHLQMFVNNYLINTNIL